MQPRTLDPDTYLAHLREDLGVIAATPRDALGAPVVACPGWMVNDLLAHHSGVLRFATAQLRAKPGEDLAKFDPAPPDEPVLETFAASAERLLAALADTDPGEHRPNWAGAETSAFWWRRMCQETVIHRFDVESAQGTAAPIDPVIAIDGIDELCDVFLPFAKRRGITGNGETVHLHSTDEDVADDQGGEWMFTFTPEGVDIERIHGKGDMAARGPAQDLLLFVWNRRPVDLTCFGEPDLLSWWPQTVKI